MLYIATNLERIASSFFLCSQALATAMVCRTSSIIYFKSRVITSIYRRPYLQLSIALLVLLDAAGVGLGPAGGKSHVLTLFLFTPHISFVQSQTL
jgi:hypothetical protein